MPWLTTEGAAHQIADGETVVGSGPHAGWRLVSHDLEARHFVLDKRGAEVTVRPCGVDGIIAINGAQSGSHAVKLQNGDTIDAGTARFLFSVERSGAYPSLKVQPGHLVETRGGVTYPLDLQAVGIGRDRLNTVVVRDPTASRFHAEVRREAGGYVLHPHGSSGTLVNGLRVGVPTRLADGDRIEIANFELKFVAGPAPEGSSAPAHAPNDEASQRRTVAQAAVMEIPPEDRAPSRKWIWAFWVVLMIAAVFWMVIAAGM